MSKKIVILDFDGTLADTKPVILNTFHRTFDAMHLPQHSDKEIAATIGLPLVKAFPMLEPMSDEMAAECTERYREIFEDVNREIGVPMFPHVADTLRLLHGKGCILTIATSRGYKSAADFIKSFGLDDIITFIIAAEDVRHAKPDAEPVTKTLKHFSLKPEDAVVIGDTHFDILMGRNAGTMTIGVSYGNGSRQSLQEAGADIIVFRLLCEIFIISKCAVRTFLSNIFAKFAKAYNQ